ncbi:tail fiber protein [Paenibacillus cellulosilyticus]|nr:tail fiber protein [Paenibacillus cellulosilyticus]
MLQSSKNGAMPRLLLAIIMGIVMVLGSLGPARSADAAGKQPLLGEIRLFPYQDAPAGWMYCGGQQIPISQNTPLFSLIGTNFGGDGKTTFAVPDLRDYEPALGTGYYIALNGVFPGADISNSSKFISELRLFPYTFTPGGWLPADHRTISIANNTPLFSLIGDKYGFSQQYVDFRLPNIAPVIPGVKYYIATEGVFPGNSTGQEFLGELVAFPDQMYSGSMELMKADGTSLGIADHSELFQIFSTTFNSNDSNSQFGTPNIQGIASVQYYLVTDPTRVPSWEFSAGPYNDAGAGTYKTGMNKQLTVSADKGLLSPTHDANPNSARIAKQPIHGTVAIQPDGSFNYSPDNGFVGADRFYYTVNNNYGFRTFIVNVEVIAPPAVTGVEEGHFYTAPVTISFDSGSASLNGEPFAKGSDVSEDGTYTLIVTGEGGETTVHFTIDQTPPTVTGVSDGGLYHTVVSAIFSGASAKLNDEDYSSGTSITDDGDYTLVLKDTAGNTTTVHFTIDLTAPTVTGVTEGTKYNAPVTVSFSDGTAKLNNVDFTSGTKVSTEGAYTLVVTDAAGNVTTLHFEIVLPRTISFNVNGGSAVADQQVNVGSKVVKPTDPTRLGYSFSGWYSDAALKTSYNFNTLVTTDLTLYAAWTKKRTYSTPPAVSGVLIDGHTLSSGVTITKNGSLDGGSEMKVTFTASVLTNLLSNGNHADTIINIDGDGQSVRVQLPVKSLQALGKLNEDAFVTVQALGASYRLPVGLFLDASGDGVVTVVIAKASKAETDAFILAAKALGVTPLVDQPYAFTLLLGDKEITDLDGLYVQRTIPAAGDVDASKSTGVWIDEAGELHFVPSTFSLVGGKTIVTIHSPHNSLYAVVKSNQKFTDIAKHSARTEIELMANKLIVNGQSKGVFAPNSSITRAEFAAILVRSLGLVEATPNKPFKDVKTTAWYAGVVGAASKAGLITGFTDGTFRPNAVITREQMITMIARALAVGGYDTNKHLSADALKTLLDRSTIAAWAQDAVLLALEADIVQSEDGKTFRPKENATRAECAVMVERMLEALTFI